MHNTVSQKCGPGHAAPQSVAKFSLWEPMSEDSVRIDAQMLLTEQRTFEDSRNSLGLQLSDMLASILRRALNDRLRFPGWKDIGGLLVRHRNPGYGFVQLGLSDSQEMSGHARKVCQIFHKRAKDMIAERNLNAGTPRT
jgi:hypothetical protein